MTNDDARLSVARHAAELFWRRGVAKTGGDAIAAAAGLSTRTVWRYFRSKEACVEPLFLQTGLRFIRTLEAWPRALAIEEHLPASLPSMFTTSQETADGIAVARLISMLGTEPAIRSVYLMASAQAEDGLASVVADRMGDCCDEYEARLCAAAVMGAVRVVDQDICVATFIHGRAVDHQKVSSRLAAAMRAAATLPFCDPVDVQGGRSSPSSI